MKLLSKNRGGLTLVETVSIVGLISLLVLFCLSLIPSFKFSNRRANMELQAGSVAQSVLEVQRSKPFAAIVPATEPAQTVDQIEYVPSIEVTDLDPKLKTVRVNVDWTWKDQRYRVFREARICDIPRS